MNIAILPDFVVTVSTIPTKQPYWQGYDQYLDCFFANDFLSPEEFAAMTPEEKRGYEAAQRHQADCETDNYMMRYNTNAYGDYTQGGGLLMRMSDIFPSKYVKAADLNGRTVTLTIKGLAVEEMTNHQSEKERKPVLYFEKATKGLVLNRTNAMAIAALYGDESDDWPGKRVSIYPTKVRAFGQMQDAIRVREEIPAMPRPVAQAAQVEENSGVDDDEDVADYDPNLFDPSSDPA